MSNSRSAYLCADNILCQILEPTLNMSARPSTIKRLSDLSDAISQPYVAVTTEAPVSVPCITPLGTYTTSLHRGIEHSIGFLALASAVLMCACLAYQVYHCFFHHLVLRYDIAAHHSYHIAGVRGCLDKEGFFDCARECNLTRYEYAWYGYAYGQQEDDDDGAEMNCGLDCGEAEEAEEGDEISIVQAENTLAGKWIETRKPENIGRTYGFRYEDWSDSEDDEPEEESTTEQETPDKCPDKPGEELESGKVNEKGYEDDNEQADSNNDGGAKKADKRVDNYGQEMKEERPDKDWDKLGGRPEKTEEKSYEVDNEQADTNYDRDGKNMHKDTDKSTKSDRKEKKRVRVADTETQERKVTRQRISPEPSIHSSETRIPREPASPLRSVTPKQELLPSTAPYGPRISRNLMEMMSEFYTPMVPAWHQYVQPAAAPAAPTYPLIYPAAPPPLQIVQGLPETIPTPAPFPAPLATISPYPLPAINTVDPSSAPRPPQPLPTLSEKQSDSGSELSDVNEDYIASSEAENTVLAAGPASSSNDSEMDVDVRVVNPKTEPALFADPGDNELARKLAAAGGGYKPTDMGALYRAKEEALRRGRENIATKDSDSEREVIFILELAEDSAVEFQRGAAQDAGAAPVAATPAASSRPGKVEDGVAQGAKAEVEDGGADEGVFQVLDDSDEELNRLWDALI